MNQRRKHHLTMEAVTTISVDLDDLAKKAVDLLMQRLEHGYDNNYPPQRLTAKYRLVVRESTTRR